MLAELLARVKKAESEVDQLKQSNSVLVDMLMPREAQSYTTVFGSASAPSSTTNTTLSSGVFNRVTYDLYGTVMSVTCIVPGITSLTLAPFITNIGPRAFQSCPLTSVVIGNSVTASALRFLSHAADLGRHRQLRLRPLRLPRS